MKINSTKFQNSEHMFTKIIEPQTVSSHNHANS